MSSKMTMKHLELLILEIIDNGYSDPMALENSRLKLPYILEAMQNLTKEQRDIVMDSKKVLACFRNLLKMSGDREIQFLALSILLSIPAVLKFGDWLTSAWFTSKPVRLEFLKLLQMPPEKKMYHDFLDALNVGESSCQLACLVYSWKCSPVVKEATSSGYVSSDTWLNFNLGTRTLSFSLEGKDIRLPFISIEHVEVGVENVKGHELLHLIIDTDSSYYSFLGLQGDTRASMFLKSGLLEQLIEDDKRASEENTGEELLDMKPSFSFQRDLTFKDGDLKHSTPLSNPRESSTQTEPSKVLSSRKSVGFSLKKKSRPTSNNRRVKTATKKNIQRKPRNTSKVSRGKACGMLVVRRSSRSHSNPSTNSKS